MSESKENKDKDPPILGSWRNFYAVVVSVLVALILVFYAITIYYE